MRQRTEFFFDAVTALWAWHKPPKGHLGFMEGVWIDSRLLSLNVGPLKIKRIEGLVRGQMLVAARDAVRGRRESIALSQTCLTDVILYYISMRSRSVSLPGISLISMRPAL